MINEKTLAVACYVLDRHKSNNTKIDKNKLNILAYICHGFMLGTSNTSLLDVLVQARAIGPVIPGVHTLVIKYKNNNTPK